MDVHQHKLRAQLVERGFLHYLPLNECSKHGSLIFRAGVPSMLLLGIFHQEEINVAVHCVRQCLALTPTHRKSNLVDLTFLHHPNADAEKVRSDPRFQTLVKRRKRRM
jgi:hypothetical protein